MPRIKLNDLEYNTEDLSEDAQAQLASLQYVEQQILKINKDYAIYQTAKISYANALKAEIDRAGIEPISETDAEGD